MSNCKTLGSIKTLLSSRSPLKSQNSKGWTPRSKSFQNCKTFLKLKVFFFFVFFFWGGGGGGESRSISLSLLNLVLFFLLFPIYLFKIIYFFKFQFSFKFQIKSLCLGCLVWGGEMILVWFFFGWRRCRMLMLVTW